MAFRPCTIRQPGQCQFTIHTTPCTGPHPFSVPALDLSKLHAPVPSPPCSAAPSPARRAPPRRCQSSYNLKTTPRSPTTTCIPSAAGVPALDLSKLHAPIPPPPCPAAPSPSARKAPPRRCQSSYNLKPTPRLPSTCTDSTDNAAIVASLLREVHLAVMACFSSAVRPCDLFHGSGSYRAAKQA